MDYLLSFGLLIFSLVGIVYSAILFTNGIESVGKKYGISEGATGSIFAAIATALPETLVPIVAIYAILSVPNEIIIHTTEYQIAMGAMLGAPLMLSSLTICLMLLFAGIKRGWDDKISPNKEFSLRDLSTMLVGCFALIAISFTSSRITEIFIGVALVLVYIYYLYKTFTTHVDNCEENDEEEKLFVSKWLKDTKSSAVIQCVFSVLLIILFSKLMIMGIEHLSIVLTKSVEHNEHKMALVFALSIILVPIATELPEKINSIIWIKKGKDSLAVGNITGALAFQATIIPAIIAFMVPININITGINGISIILTVLAALLLFYYIYNDKLTPRKSLLFFVPYLTFIIISFYIH